MNFAWLGQKLYIYRLVYCFLQQVICEDILNDLRDVFKLFIDRTLFLDCLLIDPESCYVALRGEDPPGHEDSTQQASKVKKKDGRG